ncbi:MAG: hypothetical protein WC785_00955 [Tatlockia sp.]|jgi:hypothetical protein
MNDPLGELKDSLAYFFVLQQTKVSGRFTNPLVQNLKSALESYQNGNANAINKLAGALSKALPVIEKYVDTFPIKQKMEVLAGKKGETINWYSASRPGYSPKFQYSADNLRTEGDFIPWLSLRAGKDFTVLASDTKVHILTNQSESSFSTKLGVYLRSNPDFLGELALASPRNFMQLIESPVGIFLEKHQIAKAIQHHGFALLDNKEGKNSQKLFFFLNEKLATLGHTMEKLVTDPKAKAELAKLWHFEEERIPKNWA